MKKSAKKNGFTLVEIMVVVVLVGMLAAIAIPALTKVRVASQNSTTANDLRLFSDAFETYYTEYGEFPADQAAGVIPPEIVGWISDVAWSTTPPIGGQYDWDLDINGIEAGVSVSNVVVGREQLVQLDELMDNGDLSSGALQEKANGVIYVVKF